MANEQVKVPLFAASEILTAANMNLSAGTGVPVFATTVTRDAAFGGAGEKVLAEGQLCYLSATNVVQYYDGAAWATVGPSTASGLTLVSSTTIPAAVTQYTINSVFSATYQNYRVYINNGLGTTSGLLNFYYVDSGGNPTTTGMNWQRFFMGWGATSVNTSGGSNVAFSTITNNAANCVLDVMNPNGTGNKSLHSNHPDDGQFWINQGFTANSTQYTGFKITTSAASFGSTTNVRIYGLAN